MFIYTANMYWIILFLVSLWLGRKVDADQALLFFTDAPYQGDFLTINPNLCSNELAASSQTFAQSLAGLPTFPLVSTSTIDLNTLLPSTSELVTFTNSNAATTTFGTLADFLALSNVFVSIRNTEGALVAPSIPLWTGSDSSGQFANESLISGLEASFSSCDDWTNTGAFGGIVIPSSFTNAGTIWQCSSVAFVMCAVHLPPTPSSDPSPTPSSDPSASNSPTSIPSTEPSSTPASVVCQR
jgi:hypothetical protein